MFQMPLMLSVVVLFNFNFLFIEVDKYLISVVIFAGVTNLNKFGSYLDDDLSVLVGIFVVAAPEVLFI